MINDRPLVYFFDIGYDNLIKIGKALDVDARLKDLQAGNPRIRILAVVEDNDTKLEGILHRVLKSRRYEREIYRLTIEELVLVIKALEATGFTVWRLDEPK